MIPIRFCYIRKGRCEATDYFSFASGKIQEAVGDSHSMYAIDTCCAWPPTATASSIAQESDSVIEIVARRQRVSVECGIALPHVRIFYN